MRNFFSFVASGAIGLSAAVGATSFATVDFEELNFPQALSNLGFDFAFFNAPVEPEAQVLPGENTVVRLTPTSSVLSPFDDRLAPLSAAFPEFTAAFAAIKLDDQPFGFSSGLVNGSALGGGQLVAFATRSDGSSFSEFLTGGSVGGSGFSSFSAPSSFSSGLTSLALATSGDVPIAFDDLVLCFFDCESDEAVSVSLTSAIENIPAPVPLPASALLLAVGLGGFGLMRARRIT